MNEDVQQSGLAQFGGRKEPFKLRPKKKGCAGTNSGKTEGPRKREQTPRKEGEEVLSLWDPAHTGTLSLVGIILVVSPGTVRSGVLTTSEQLIGKECAGDAGDMGSSPGSGRSPGGRNGNPLQYSCLKTPTDRGAWWAIVHWVA